MKTSKRKTINHIKWVGPEPIRHWDEEPSWVGWLILIACGGVLIWIAL